VLAQLPIAFAAGFLSFLAPCVLPLVPGYLSAISAVDADRLGERGAARRVVLASLPFLLGFTVVFVALGAAAAWAGSAISQRLLEQVAGFLLVVFGLAFMGLLPLPKGLVGAGLLAGAQRRRSNALLGAAFAVCAAPCIGPVLASILVLAGDAGTVAQGSVLLAAYSAGLAVPFLIAGVVFAPAMGAFRWLRDRFLYLQVAAGATLVALGLLLFFGRFWWLRSLLNRVLEAPGISPV
jgi:cytochrome c-type biogenesis protein